MSVSIIPRIIHTKRDYHVVSNLDSNKHPPSDYIFEIETIGFLRCSRNIPEYNMQDNSYGMIRLELNKQIDNGTGQKCKRFIIVENYPRFLRVITGKTLYSNSFKKTTEYAAPILYEKTTFLNAEDILDESVIRWRIRQQSRIIHTIPLLKRRADRK